MDWREDYQRKLTTAEEAVKIFKDNDVIGVVGGTAIPPAISEALGKRGPELKNIKICQGFALAFHEYMKPEHKETFHIETIFMGPAERYCLQLGTADFVPCHLGNMGDWLVDAGCNAGACVVTPPDENGWMNRSCFGGLAPQRVIDQLDRLIVEVNENTPWLCSDGFKIHVSQCDHIVENHIPIFEIPEIPITPIEEEIAGRIAEMVPDGSTIQLGLGGLANCIGHFLTHKKDLGVHAEVISNSIMDLIKCGAVNNSKKTLHPGKVAYTFCVGTRQLMDFLHHNETFQAFEIDYINNPSIIAQNDNLVSINNALMFDLTGQAASESIGTFQYSATGGQVAFVNGSQKSRGGKSILALPATRTDKDGKMQSRIVAKLPEGTVVTTSRNDVEWVVTEFGAVKLTNKSLSWRAKNLITLAHPDFRDELTFNAKKIGWL
ncbi:MAG: acetyl-CoA hydrolase/transferase family protein [Chitinophagales bacterium]